MGEKFDAEMTARDALLVAGLPVCGPVGAMARFVTSLYERGRLAGRKEMAALLKKHEYASEHRVDYDNTVRCCPECGGIDPTDPQVDGRGSVDGRPVGHRDECDIRKLVEKGPGA